MLHPQARALLDLIIANGVPPTHTLSPIEARRLYRERRAATQPLPPQIGSVEDLFAPGPHGTVPLRHYRPLRPAATVMALPLLLYFHGGGWVIGDLDTHDTLCRQLSNASGCAVIAVDYRMGPEHRFPKAVDDCVAALDFVHANAMRLGIDAERIAVGGDSAGGNLAAVVAIAARDAGAARVRFQLLIYPATDMRRNSASHAENGQGYLLTSDSMKYYHDHYIDDDRHDQDWRASPLLATDLSGLPRAFVMTAGFDPLRDEGRHYADRLNAAGTPCTEVCFERQIHGFITMGRVLEEANSAVTLCAALTREALLTD